MFSSRLPAHLHANLLSQAAAAARAGAGPCFDLTETNPTVVGLTYPSDVWASLANSESCRYVPEAFGALATRAELARDYRSRGLDLRPEHTVLTASTSEAYSLLFKLACDPGDDVLVPAPSYPLFEWLTVLDSVRAVPYRLDRHDGWRIDRNTVVRALSERTRAVLVVSPNNPTGSMLDEADRAWLVALARDHGLMLIADEVFADYPLSPRAGATTLLGERGVLTWTLGGLSKSAGLPQMKLAWMTASGPDDVVHEALDRLAVIADTYLSVATPVQMALPALLRAGRQIREQIARRLRENLATLREHVASHSALTFFEPEGGWSVVLRVPAVDSEERIVLRLITEAAVIVHPGYFFDLAEEAFLVLSLLPAPEVFREGLARMSPVVLGART